MTRRRWRTVVVAVDDTPESQRALRAAAGLAHALGATVQLVTVTSPGLPTIDDRQLLDELTATVDAVTSAPVVLTGDDVAAALCAHAGAHDALLCLASHGRNALGALVMGSVTTDVLTTSHEPVVVVGPLAEPRTAIDHIAAAVDSSAAGKTVIADARWLADVSGARLDVVSVVAPGAANAVVVEGADLLEGADVVATLVEATQGRGVDLLVLGSHGRGRLQRVVRGSVVGDVVHSARCPVLVVPAGRG